MRVGVTGHSNLSDESIPVVSAALRAVLEPLDGPLVGVSCLARGADQVFADVVLDLGGVLEVVLPSADYRERKVKPDNRAAFESLISRAERITTMPFEAANRDSYMAASDALLDCVDQVVAVWDREPSDGRGGTADVVAAARARGLHVDVLWPDGATRR